MTITDEMIEAVARAIQGSMREQGVLWEHELQDEDLSTLMMATGESADLSAVCKAAITTIAPIVREMALREAADEAYRIGVRWAEDADCPKTSRVVGGNAKVAILALIPTGAK